VVGLAAEVSALAKVDTRWRSGRPELRGTPEESDLIDWAAAGADRTTFVVTNAVEAARRVLADRVRSGRRGASRSGRPSTGVGPGTFRGYGG
jgi:hypothetical protein